MRYLKIIFCFFLFSQWACKADKLKPKPNIVIILTDDMGFSDVGCYGGEIPTPNIDQLADEGIRFTSFYNAARCCPTRASLMTGLYPHDAGIGWMTHWNYGPGYEGYLTDRCVTIAEVLRDAGYQTNMTGKWHAGGIRESWPENRGFQRFYGIHHWVDSYFKVLRDCEVYEDGVMVIPENDYPVREGFPDKEWYTTDVFTDKALEYIEESVKNPDPFFLYVAYNVPHWPLEAHDEVIGKYLDSYKQGWDQLRKEKYQRMIQMGIISKECDLSEPVEMTPWKNLSDSARLNTEFRRAIYAAQIDILDQNVGRIISKLKKEGVYDNTLILFLSDNGCSGQPLEELGGRHFESNTRWNYEEWRRLSARRGASQGVDWALTSNTPFRKYKKFVHEGGISTPLIVSWPDVIKEGGKLEKTPSHLIDIMPTLLDITDTNYPKIKNEKNIIPLSGISLNPLLLGKSVQDERSIYWEHEGHAAIRKDKWKLVSLNARNKTNWELYDMEKDRTETKNLAGDFPEIVEQLKQEWTKWATEKNVTPWPRGREIKERNPLDK